MFESESACHSDWQNGGAVTFQRLQCSGYIFWMIGLMLSNTPTVDMPGMHVFLVSVLQRHTGTVFKLLTPNVDQSYRSGVPKSVFEEKQFLNERIFKFCCEVIQDLLNLHIHASSVTVSKAEVTKMMHGICHKRNDRKS